MPGHWCQIDDCPYSATGRLTRAHSVYNLALCTTLARFHAGITFVSGSINGLLATTANVLSKEAFNCSHCDAVVCSMAPGIGQLWSVSCGQLVVIRVRGGSAWSVSMPHYSALRSVHPHLPELLKMLGPLLLTAHGRSGLICIHIHVC